MAIMPASMGMTLGAEALYILVVLGVPALLYIFGICIAFFRMDYLNAGYDRWVWKYNRSYPTLDKVAFEIEHLFRCSVVSVLVLTVAVLMGMHGLTDLLVVDSSILVNILWIVIAFFLVDFYEYMYHYLGHKYDSLWAHHKRHHKFFNPTPFGVIADDIVDQLFRTVPIVLFPVLFPKINGLVLAVVFSIDPIYGTWLHTGHDVPKLRSIANYVKEKTGGCRFVLNTSAEHYLHHAISGRSSPVYCGFYIKVWDWLLNTHDEVRIEELLADLGPEKRSRKEFEAEVKHKIPDYGQLATFSFWCERYGFSSSEKNLAKGATAVSKEEETPPSSDSEATTASSKTSASQKKAE